jgi:hypothetical protein
MLDRISECAYKSVRRDGTRGDNERMMTMRKAFAQLLAGAFVIALLAGCAAVTPMTGTLYVDMKGPVAVGDASGMSKVGTAKATAIIGIVTGDASIQAAMQNGGITKVHHVDSQVKNILGIYAEYTTTVYGE